MRKNAIVVAVAAVLVFALQAVGVYAGATSDDPHILSRIENQQKRIDQGVKSGQLTPQEQEMVQGNLDRIKADEAKLKAEGKITKKEKERLNHKLNLNDGMIKKTKNNAIVRID